MTNIDPTRGVPVGSLAHATHHRRRLGRWQQRLLELYRRVEAGELAYDTLYPLGSFDSRAGAYNVVHRFIQNPESIPTEIHGVLDLEWRNVDHVDDSGEVHKGSEVWGAVISPETQDA